MSVQCPCSAGESQCGKTSVLTMVHLPRLEYIIVIDRSFSILASSCGTTMADFISPYGKHALNHMDRKPSSTLITSKKPSWVKVSDQGSFVYFGRTLFNLLFSVQWAEQVFDYGIASDVLFDENNFTCVDNLYKTPEDVALLTELTMVNNAGKCSVRCRSTDLMLVSVQ